MNTKELLLECKIKLKIESDYALSKNLAIPRARISQCMHGQAGLGSYELTRIAITLNRDPISLIAEYEAATEKNATKREFWESFLKRAAKATKTVTLAAICGFILLTGLSGSNDAGGRFKAS
jgi:hypothetical protein